MITIRNPKQAQSLTVIADAVLVVGQLVKLVQAAASGDPGAFGFCCAAFAPRT